MEQRDLDRTLATLGSLREFEHALATMYEVAGRQWPHDPQCWQALAAAEEGHAHRVRSLAALVAERPRSFVPRRRLAPVAVELQIDYVHHRTREFAVGRMAELQALIVMRDLEASILEDRFYELVSSDDPEFTELVAQIVAETQGHVETLEARIRTFKEDARA